MLESFRSRLVISNLLITLVGLLVIVFVFSGVLSNRTRDIRTRSLAGESRLVANQIEYLFQHGGSRTDLQPLVIATSRALKVRAVVVGPRGSKVIVDSAKSTPFANGEWTLNRKALQQEHSAQRSLQSGSLVQFQTPLIGTRGRPIGAVVLVAHVTDVNPGLLDLRDVFLIVLGTALLVWLAIGMFFTFSISRPLLRVTAATRRMARGRYDTRVAGGGTGEIGKLAESFNVMAAQVQDSSRVLKDFVANVSHDLRTPLTMISGFSEALIDGTARADEARESAVVIHEEATKMQHMVDDLLQLTRLESGLLTFRRQPIAVRPFVQTVVEGIARTRADRPSATITNLVPATLPFMDVDREHLERALRNLLGNALQYTPSDGSIKVRAQAIGHGWVEIAVSDTGAGIASHDLSRIFERFYRTDKSREREHGHSGLGLAIVREIVEGHGGKIAVESELDRGTTFRFTMPQAARAEPASDLPVAGETVKQVAQ